MFAYWYQRIDPVSSRWRIPAPQSSANSTRWARGWRLEDLSLAVKNRNTIEVKASQDVPIQDVPIRDGRTSRKFTRPSLTRLTFVCCRNTGVEPETRKLLTGIRRCRRQNGTKRFPISGLMFIVGQRRRWNRTRPESKTLSSKMIW